MNKYNKLIYIAIVLTAIQIGYSGCASTPEVCEFTPPGNLGTTINTVYNEYSPAFASDTTILFFTSKRSEEMESESEDIYYTLKPYGYITGVHKISSPKLTTDYNEGSPSFSKDGRFVIFARSNFKDTTYGGTDLYSADVFNDTIFTNIQDLGNTVNTTFWDSQPTLSPDGKTLIFASDRPGGWGGVDLWKSIKQNDNTWSTTENLGPSVNTSGNEYSPYLYEDGKNTILFFATDGRGEKGNLDIYYSYKTGKNSWRTPININQGSDVNTPFNEMFPCPVNNLKELIYASNDTSYVLNNTSECKGRGYDLYRKQIKLEPNCIPIEGDVLNAKTNQPLDTIASIRFINEINKEEVSKNTTLPNSSYSIGNICVGNYNVEVQAPGYITKNEIISISTSNTKLKHYLFPKTDTVKIIELKANAPFFVTGYYRLNVPDNLKELISLQKTKLKKADYIENIESSKKLYNKYYNYALYIQNLFKDSVFALLGDSLLSKYVKDKNKWLKIQIKGYTDPRHISGTYLENDVTLIWDSNSKTIKKGDNIDNFILSDLRAFYTKEYMDKILTDSCESYRQLKSEGRIKYYEKGLGIDMYRKDKIDEFDNDKRRRIWIEVYSVQGEN